jgi:hypothetical protein
MADTRRIRAALVFGATSLALLAPALHGIASHSCAVGLERSAIGEFSGARALGVAQQKICGFCLSASQLRSKLAAPALVLPTASGSTQYPVELHCTVALVPPARSPEAPRAPPRLPIVV